jgi:spore germination cell wall hydrolase CwlJ-like protein
MTISAEPKPQTLTALKKANPAAVATLLGFVVAVLGAGLVVIQNVLPPSVNLPKSLDTLPELPSAPTIPNDPVELAFGTDQPVLNMSDFNVEGTANNATAYEDVSKEEARKINLGLSFSTQISPAAAPFFLVGKTPLDSARAQHCLSLAVYYEAASETMQGQYGVAQVVINRMRHPAWPHSICGVVFQGAERRSGCQFTFTCDGSLSRKPTGRAWLLAQGVASAALNGFVMPEVGHATHYHTDWVAPRWAPSLRKLKQIGTHIFYTWQGGGGNPRAFTNKYDGQEPWPTLAALSAPSLGSSLIAQASIDGAAVSLAALGADKTATRPAQDRILSAAITSPPSSLSQTGASAVTGQSDPAKNGLTSGSQSQNTGTYWADVSRASPPLPKPDANGLMPEPDLASILPKYNLPTDPPKRPTLTVPPTTETKRQTIPSRAMDGL